MPHAFLFDGLKGVGKLRFAKTLAAALLCDTPTLEGFACGVCKQCKLMAVETHSDLRMLEPEEGKAIIKVELIRKMIDFISQSSLMGGWKVVILHPAEALNLSAANALLKSLEEPSDKSIILLVSNSAGQLLPTVRSRCQRIDFGTPLPETSLQWLQQQIGEKKESPQFSESELLALLDLASGAPLKAEEYASLDALNENNTMLDELARVLKNDQTCSSVAERWSDDLFVVRLGWTIRWLEKTIQFKMSLLQPIISGNHGEKMMSYLAERCSEQALFELHRNSLSQYQIFLGTSNPNKQLAFESLLNSWSALMRRGQ